MTLSLAGNCFSSKFSRIQSMINYTYMIFNNFSFREIFYETKYLEIKIFESFGEEKVIASRQVP